MGGIPQPRAAQGRARRVHPRLRHAVRARACLHPLPGPAPRPGPAPAAGRHPGQPARPPRRGTSARLGRRDRWAGSQHRRRRAETLGHGPAGRPSPGHPPGHARLPARRAPFLRRRRRAMNPLLITSLALAGLAAGWVLRAVIFRYAVPPGEPARQCCPACGSQILAARWRPWLLLAPSSRCPACGQRTGPPALAVEAITAILLGALAAIDAAVRRLPDLLTAPAYAGTAAALLLAAAISGHWHTLAQAVLGGIAVAGFYLALALISPAGMGLGDVKAAASLSTLLAWLGWRALLAGTLAGFLLAGLYGAALLISGRATRKQHIPFGPFMIAGAFLVILAWHLVGS